MAQEVEQHRPPAHWRAVLAYDDAPTYRVEAPGAPAAWLGQTTIPMRRAAATLAHYHRGPLNISVPCVGAGQELLQLLTQQRNHIAAYLFVDDLTALAAVLQLHKLDTALRGHRCIFVPPQNELDWLLALLDRHPGLLPPGNIVKPPGVSPARLSQVRTVCQQVNNVSSRQRQTAFEAAAQRTLAAISNDGSPRVALLALSGDPRSHHVVRDAAHGDSSDIVCAPLTLSSPTEVHPLKIAKDLAAFQPTHLVCVDTERDVLPTPLRDRARVWRLRLADVPVSVDRDTCYHAGSPTIAEELLKAGADPARVRVIPPGVRAQQERRSASATPARFILMVGDRPDVRPVANGVVQPTHKLLWTALLEQVRANVWNPAIAHADALLEVASRASGVRLGDAETERMFVRRIRLVVVPATVVDVLASLLAEAGPIRVVGRGWRNVAAERTNLVWCGAQLDPTDAAQAAATVIATPADPLTPELLTAAGTGTPVALFAAGRSDVTSELAEVLREREHFSPLRTRADVATVVAAARSGSTELRESAAAAAAHLRAEHTWTARLRAIASADE